MKKFTKMFSTLMLLCVAGVANAQDWQDLPVTGWVHEWPVGVEAQVEAGQYYDGEKEADADGVYKVYCRSQADAEESGVNAGFNNDGVLNDWDSQFFITFGEANALQAGDKIQVTMKVKADAATSKAIGTQAHGAPGTYKFWQCIPSVNFTEEWTDYQGEYTIAGDAVGMYTIAFNLAIGAENNFYFKDIVAKVLKDKPVEAWTSIITNGDMEGEDVSCFSKTEQGIGGEGGSDGPYKAKISEGVGNNGTRGILVQSQDNPSQDWSTQFFITSKKLLPAGTKYRIKFDYKADQEGGFDTQTHQAPGDYIHYVGIGSGTFTDTWQTYEAEGLISEQQSTAEKITYTIAFNLAKNKSATAFCFDNIVFEVPSDVYETLEDAPVLNLANAPEAPVEVEWVDIMLNGDLEGTDNRCVYVKNAGEDAKVGTIEEGIGADDSRGVKVVSADREDTGEVDDQGNPVYAGADWDAQFWIRLPQSLPAGTPIRVTFDYKASNDGHVDTQSHQEPGQYIHWACVGSPEFTTDWQTWEYTTRVPNECDGTEGKIFHSIAFNLSCNHIATEFFFDNIKIEIPKEAVGENDFPAVVGDLNGDGRVNSSDVQKTYGFMAAGETGETVPAADLNGDGLINSGDVQKLYGIMASQSK